MNTDALTHALDKAKIDLMGTRNSVFLTSVLFRLKIIWDESIPTAGTEGIHLWINPTWFMNMSHRQRVGLLAHEAWHVALDHMTRGIGYVHGRYGIAADYVINNLLDNAGYELPDHGYMDHKYDDMSTEEVYALLEEENKHSEEEYATDIIYIDATDADENQQRIHKEHIDNLLIQAKIQADTANEPLAGNIPEDILRRLDDLLNPKLPWNTILQNYVNTLAKQDYTFARPNKRFQPDYYLATLGGFTIEHIYIAVDSSGSVTDAQFAAFLTEIQNIKDFAQPQQMTIVDFDYEIKAVHEVAQFDSVLDIEFKGYGGTDLRPALDKAKEMNPTVLIVFSDLQCERYETELPFPTLWIVVNNPDAKVDFGQKIDLVLTD